MKTLRPISRSTTEVSYADPDARMNIMTVKNNVQPKKAGAVTVYNAKSSINLQKTVTLPQDPECADKCAPKNQEKLSLSVNLSGSTQSKEEIKQLWFDTKTAVDAAIADLSAGFLPVADAVFTMDNPQT